MALYGAHKDRGELRIHESLDELSTDLAAYVAEISEVSVKERGVFTIALSGGSLIGFMGYYFLFYICCCYCCCFCGVLNLVCIFMVESRKLCEAPYNKTVDWAKWYIFWADERVVAKSHSDSNYKLAKDALLTKVFSSLDLSLYS